MDALTNIFRNATRAIDGHFFRLPIDQGIPVYRERVYCYELYHQMRKRWPRQCEYCLNGEVNKCGHPLLARLEADGFQPDLLVHGPGNMLLNHAIIEVKCVDAPVTGIRKDLRALSLFRNRVGYERAIYLFDGRGSDTDVVGRVLANTAQVEQLAAIELWFHSAVGTAARHLRTVRPDRRR